MGITLKDILSKEIVTAFFAAVAGFFGILKYFNYRTRADKMGLVRDAFKNVVASLASKEEVERLAGAVLLRRFFDPDTELGLSSPLRQRLNIKRKKGVWDTPYWKETVNVVASILRSQGTGNFQKVLADGLAFAPTLERADLQKTNLQFAYLGLRKIGSSKTQEVEVNLSYADFFRADLSGASLKGAKAQGAVFYQARMRGTVLSNADLRDANFYDADLKGANFKGALLTGASFAQARNISPDLAAKLDEKGLYKDTSAFQPSSTSREDKPLCVFISKPSCLNYHQQQLVGSFQLKLEAEGLTPLIMERTEYPSFGAIGEIQRLMSNCAGAIIFGFRQMEVKTGVWRSGTTEEKAIEGMYLPTPWNQIEAGMAAMLGHPIFVLCEEGVEGGIFDSVLSNNQIYRVSVDENWDSTNFTNAYTTWCADVRERNRLPN